MGYARFTAPGGPDAAPPAGATAAGVATVAGHAGRATGHIGTVPGFAGTGDRAAPGSGDPGTGDRAAPGSGDPGTRDSTAPGSGDPGTGDRAAPGSGDPGTRDSTAPGFGDPAGPGPGGRWRGAPDSRPTPVPAAADRGGHPTRLRPHGLVGGVHLTQLVGWQVAAAALLVAAVQGPVAVLAAALPVGLVLVLTGVRIRRRWLYRWIGDWLRYRLRDRVVGGGHPDPVSELLGLLGASAVAEELRVDGAEVGLISHDRGLAALVELDPTDGGLAVPEPIPLPPLPSLLPAGEAPGPAVSLQLLVETVPAPAPAAGQGLAAFAYRELSGGQVPAGRRAFLALQVARSPELFDDAGLRPALVAALRKLGRQLRREGVGYRLLAVGEVPTAVTQLARLDVEPVPHRGGPAQPAAQEAWRAWWLAGQPHSSHHLTRWPVSPWPVEALLRQLPASSVLSVSVTRAGVSDVDIEVAFRLAAPDPAGLARAERALADAVRGAGGRTGRLDGQQHHGLAATLPFGGPPRSAAPGTTAPVGAGPAVHRAATSHLDGLGLGTRGAGVLLGRDRYDAPVTLDLFRPVPTQLVLVGGARCAQLLAVRAAATGARILIHSPRALRLGGPLQRFGLGPDSLAYDPAAPVPPASRDRPQLLIVDAPPGGGLAAPGGGLAASGGGLAASGGGGLAAPGGGLAAPGGGLAAPGGGLAAPGGGLAAPGGGLAAGGAVPWRTTLVLRDELTSRDVDLLAHAEHVLLQPLTAAEAALAAPALGIGQAREWLSRTPQDMVAVVWHGTLRWVLLHPTGIELETLTSVARGPV
jgi:type VII secretion protein EccE